MLGSSSEAADCNETFVEVLVGTPLCHWIGCICDGVGGWNELLMVLDTSLQRDVVNHAIFGCPPRGTRWISDSIIYILKLKTSWDIMHTGPATQAPKCAKPMTLRNIF